MSVLSFVGWVRVPALAALFCAWLLLGTSDARADSAPPGVGGLLTRGSWDVELDFDWQTDRAFLIRELSRVGVRVAGPEAVPAEMPRFLAGELRELRCAAHAGHTNCRMSIQWEVIDAVSGVSTYETITRVNRYQVEGKSRPALREALLSDSIASLVKRERFREAFQHSLQPESAALPPATFRACAAAPIRMPAQAPDAIAASVLIDLGSGMGSGFFLNDEGLVLTAAHVTIQPELKVRLSNGQVYPAGVVRMNREADVALVRVRGLRNTPCLRLSDREPSVGSDLYAIGAPGDRNLSFSLTRGIVSGLRHVRGFQRLQTDTPISPGNSGGPLLGPDGRVQAVVQAKVVRAGVEGVAFGLPSSVALAALALRPGVSTDQDLSDVLLVLPSLAHSRDPADLPLPLDQLEPLEVKQPPTASAVPALSPPPSSPAEVPPTDRTPAVPAYVHALRWGGLGLSAVGLVVAGATSDGYSKSSSTRAEYERLRTWNDVGWIAAGVGAGSFTLSFLFGDEAPARVSAAWSRQHVALGVEGNL
jgi:S1-C subfamily serine protease